MTTNGRIHPVTQPARPIRVGAVNYLNTKPLVYQFEKFAPHAELIFDLPSRLADRLASAELDVALIPSIEFFQDPSYSILSDVCIGCRGPVLSVKLFSRVPMQAIRTLALDEGSRTSAALVQILLKQRFGLQPQLEALPIGATIDQTNADAVLLIGDRAIHSPAGQFAEIWDLGDEWCRWSELPFVFAMWTARAGVDLQGVDVALGESRDAGLANLAEIAAKEAPQLGLTVPQCLAYLRDNLYFYLGQREQQGLALFYQHAAELGLAPVGVDLGLSHCTNA
ncbi:MAG: menaquinone biosynthesis protein [Planctomycetota bacterium]|nr:menaquinone biosynthesis protein [Planctomycetota bacterium]